MSEPRRPDRTENIIATIILGLAAIFHAWGASVGWTNGNLPGCEFRQTQTALSAYFILAEKNYSLAYPTPVLGKPWSIPMEFPLYQWTVAKLAQKSGWNLTQVGRAVSLGCFYLALPALYLLLRRLGLPWARALVVLGFVLSCPLYLFYARSFLIETMAWMFGAWFLLGYVCTVEKRSPGWWVVAAIAGAGAGLVKVTTWMVFLLPAGTWTLVWFWQDWRAGKPGVRWQVLRGRAGWAALAIALPLVAAWWWVRYSDGIKALSPTGEFLQSTRLANYNFGEGARFDAAVWNQHWRVILHELATIPVLLVAGMIALFFARARWWLIALLVGYFFAVQLTFPILYAWHEYYYVAIAMLLMGAIGLAACGLLESRLPRWAAWIIIGGLLLGQGWGYWTRYYEEQKHISPGGSDLTMALRRVTEPEDVIVIAGNDWSSSIPYYAQRRALMIRRDLERTWQVIDPAFRALESEQVGALVLSGQQRENQDLLNRAVAQFGLDSRPAFQWFDTDVYLRRQYRTQDLAMLIEVPGITLPPEAKEIQKSRLGREVEMLDWRPRHQAGFSMMNPRPWKYFTTFGLNPAKYHGYDYVWVHPETRLWFRVPAGRHRMSLKLEFIAEAYDEKLTWQDRSDGVELLLLARAAGAPAQPVGRRLLDPRANPGDRGRLAVDFDFVLEQPADLELAVLPGPAGSMARDWLLLGGLQIK